MCCFVFTKYLKHTHIYTMELTVLFVFEQVNVLSTMRRASETLTMCYFLTCAEQYKPLSVVYFPHPSARLSFSSTAFHRLSFWEIKNKTLTTIHAAFTSLAGFVCHIPVLFFFVKFIYYY